MPQLDFSTFPSQAFWLIISFLLMWLIMSQFIVPKIVDILNQRQRKIDDHLSAAQGFRQSAEEALMKYQQTLKSANEQADKLLYHMQEDLNKKIKQKEEENARQLAAVAADNQKAIEEKYSQIMAQMEQKSAEITMLLVNKLDLNNIILQEDIVAVKNRNEKNE